MLQIAPTILTADFQEARKKITRLQGLISHIHLDVIDSSFTLKPTISFEQFNKIKMLKNFRAVFHLMVADPLKTLTTKKNILAKAIICQVEQIKEQQQIVDKITSLGIKPGLACDLLTPTKAIGLEMLSQLDMVLIMMVKAGTGGQKLQTSRLAEIQRLKKIREKNGFSFQIVVDGGVNLETIKDCWQAGADVFSVGSAVWKHKNLKEIIQKLRFLE